MFTFMIIMLDFSSALPTSFSSAQIINTMVHNPLLGDILLTSKGIADDRKLGGDECAVQMKDGLNSHGLGVVCAKNVNLYEKLDACKLNPQLQKQLIAAVSTDNCTTALATGTKFVEEARAAVTVSHGPKIGEALHVKTARCLSHALDLLCGKGALLFISASFIIVVYFYFIFCSIWYSPFLLTLRAADVLEFAPKAKELFEQAAAIASGTSRAQRDHLNSEFGGKVRRMLDSDGARWGDRLKVAVALNSGDLWSRLHVWSRAELAAATAAREGTAHLTRLVELLGSAECRFEVQLLAVLFGDLISILKSSQSSFLGSVTYQEMQTITALRTRCVCGGACLYLHVCCCCVLCALFDC
jgi:hypothetical protein